MGKGPVACALALAVVSWVSVACAQEAADQKPAGRHRGHGAGGHGDSGPLNMKHEKLGSEGLADVARARMKNGDCVGAIEVFDAALRTATDPTLHRDRGLCHDRLGDPFPAIDDFRAYLTADPDAPDAESIRDRLSALEQANLGYSSSPKPDVPGDVEGGASASANAGAPASAPASGSKAVVAGTTPDMDSKAGTDYTDRDDDPMQGTLRRGRGFSFAPFFAEHKWGVAPGAGGASFGDSGSWSESVGIAVRYSFGAASTVFVEAGYEHFNATAIDPVVVSGLTSQVGYEMRFRIDDRDDNQLFGALGLGFEHLSVQPGVALVSASSVGGFIPRARFGWRHLVASSAGFEVSLDGGIGNFFAYSNFPFDSHAPTAYLLGLNVALVWGL